jgi:hypothetical protein
VVRRTSGRIGTTTGIASIATMVDGSSMGVSSQRRRAGEGGVLRRALALDLDVAVAIDQMDRHRLRPAVGGTGGNGIQQGVQRAIQHLLFGLAHRRRVLEQVVTEHLHPGARQPVAGGLGQDGV